MFTVLQVIQTHSVASDVYLIQGMKGYKLEL